MVKDALWISFGRVYTFFGGVDSGGAIFLLFFFSFREVINTAPRYLLE